MGRCGKLSLAGRPVAGPGGGGVSARVPFPASAVWTRSARARTTSASAGGDRALEQLHPAARAGDLGLDLYRADRDGAQQLVGHASQAQPIRSGQSLERPHEQRGGGAAVERVRIPRAAGELGRDKTAIRAFEH